MTRIHLLSATALLCLTSLPAMAQITTVDERERESRAVTQGDSTPANNTGNGANMMVDGQWVNEVPDKTVHRPDLLNGEGENNTDAVQRNERNDSLDTENRHMDDGLDFDEPDERNDPDRVGGDDADGYNQVRDADRSTQTFDRSQSNQVRDADRSTQTFDRSQSNQVRDANRSEQTTRGGRDGAVDTDSSGNNGASENGGDNSNSSRSSTSGGNGGSNTGGGASSTSAR